MLKIILNAKIATTQSRKVTLKKNLKVFLLGVLSGYLIKIK
jgi:hypothetical protein